jgi:CRISPR/Cas system CMR subunit Cmr6 (Cas7 group RAMP superfamily)
MKKKSHITDSVLFFYKITDAYLHLEGSILMLHKQIPDLSPQQIKNRCHTLLDEKNRLEKLDKQMFDIIALTGPDVYEKSLLDGYRAALARAKKASNNLYDTLKSLKIDLEEEFILLFGAELHF